VNRSGGNRQSPAGHPPAPAGRRRWLVAAGLLLIPVLGRAATLEWKGSEPGALWDVGVTLNWLNAGTPSVFANGDDARFGHTAATFSPVITGVVQPGSVAVGGNKDYQFSGVGKIAGATGLRKEGPNMLVIANANSFTGPVVVDNGVLQYGAAGALGAGAGSVYVTNRGSVDLNKTDTGLRTLAIAGAGYQGRGAIINTSTNTGVNNLVGALKLLGDATVSSVGRWNVKPTGTVTGNGYKLTKTGPGAVWFYRCGATGLGDIEVVEGTLGAYPPVDLGDPVKTVTVQPGATLYLWRTTDHAPPFNFNKKLLLNNASVASGFTPANGGSNMWSGPIQLNLINTFNLGSGDLHLLNTLSGPGGFIKAGARTLYLHGLCTYTGPTIINVGQLVLAPSVSLASGMIQVNSGATLEVRGPALTMGAGSRLGGNQGIIAGNVVIGAGATLQTGLDELTVRNLQINGDLTIQPGGTHQVVVNKTGAGLANDRITGLTSVQLGGTLSVVNVGAPLAAGDALPLFMADTYHGGWERILPAVPGPGLAWDTGTLAVDGTLRVIADGVDPTAPLAVSVTNNTLQLTWPPAYLGWTLQAQTNAPGEGLGPGWVDVPGSSALTQLVFPIHSSPGSVFYRLIWRQTTNSLPLIARVGTFNVGHFNQGKLGGYQGDDPQVAAAAWSQWIEQQALDIFFVNEWNFYFDKDGTMPARALLLDPFYDYVAFGQQNTWIYNGIATNFKITNYRQVQLTHPEYYATLADWAVGGVTITLMSVHVPWQEAYHESSIDALIAELQKHEYLICGGDLNAPDRNVLRIKNAGFNLANGGDEGWFCTAAKRCSQTTVDVHIDNIITSTNITIRYVSAPTTGLNDLDHLPVLAEVLIQ